MAKGSSKIGGGSSYSLTSVVTQGGTTLDLTSMPLVYGQKEKAIQGNLRTSLEAQENKRKNAKIEYGMLYDENGRALMTEAKGGKGSVSMPSYIYQKATAMTHNHPRGKNEEDILGGTFSIEDFGALVRFDNLQTIRASAAEGTYSFTKGKNFNGKGFMQFAKDSNNKRYGEMKQSVKSLSNTFAQQRRAGNKPSFDKYVKDCNVAMNKYLIDCHNDLLAGQKQYGYSYMLER